MNKKAKAPKAALRTQMPVCHSINASACKDNNIFSNNSMMNKIISFLKEKNRFNRLKKSVSVRHIICAINSAKCLELKTFDFKEKKPRRTRRLPDLADWMSQS